MSRYMKIRRRIAAVILSFGMVMSPMAGTVVSHAENAQEVKGEAIVCFRQEPADAFKSDAALKDDQEKEIESESYVDESEALLVVDSPDEVLAAAADLDAATGMIDEEVADSVDTDDSDLPGVITLVQSDRLSTQELIAELEARDDVIYAEPNYTFRAEAQDFTDEQWAANSTYGLGISGWNNYEEGKPKPDVDTSEQVVAIVDTGVDYTHEDLAEVMWSEGENYPELVRLGGGKYGFNGTRVNSGADPYDSTDPMDDGGHGTHCAGIVAAAWNGFGVSGVTSGAKLMAIKASNEKGVFPTDAVIRAYEYMITAKKAGVNICASNNSYGGNVCSQTEVLLVAEAGKAGIVCCFAAGNDARNLDSGNASAAQRASYPQVLVVGAGGSEGEIAEFSNYGRRDVDVFAPGVKIMSTVPMGKGTPSERTSAFQCDGASFEVNYGEKTVFGDDPMELRAVEGTSVSIRQGVDGKNVLHVESEDGYFKFRTKVFSDLKGLKGGVVQVYVNERCEASIEAVVVAEEGETENIGDRSPSLIRGWNDVGFLADEYFGDTTATTNSAIELSLTLTKGEDNLKEADIRFIRFVDKTENYVAWNGTSMATPHITGSVAVLAAAYPEDSAEKLAARVTGSVLPVSGMKDKCLSGGVFRLDKALAGETVPVPQSATAENGTLTVRGFFFGDSEGELTVAGKTCTVSAWSDEEITAELPADLPEGESMVEVTSGKGTGHNYFVFSKSKKQFDSLPLPGVKVADTGLYEDSDAAKAKYPDFYYGTLAGMTALDGSLYAFFVSKESTTVIYQYQINKKSWKRVYSGGDYYPTGAVCNWNGKVLFLGANQPKEDSAVGCYDPKAGKVTWKKYRDDSYEYGQRLINTGAGIYLLGGYEAMDGDNPKNQNDISTLRKLDPASMTVKETGGDEFRLNGEYLVTAVTGDDTFYTLRGYNYKTSNMADMFKAYVDPAGKKDAVSDLLDTKGKLFTNMDQNGGYNCVGVATKQGVLVTGPVRTDEDGHVVEDTYMISYDGQSFKAMDKVVSRRPMYLMAAAGYKGKCYVLGLTAGSDANYVFTAIDADLYPTEGETSYKNEWVKGRWYDKNGLRSYTYTGKWHKNTKGWWYADQSGWYPKNQWQKIDGKWYYFKADGYMAAEEFVSGWWLNKDGAWTDNTKYGWHKTARGWWYGVSGGWYAKGKSYTIDGVKYSFDKQGYLKTQ